MNKAFQNPTGNWSHDGGYSVELIEGADTSHLPFDTGLVTVAEGVVTVTNGRIKQTMGGIRFHAGESPFGWSYHLIKRIHKADGSLLWQNRHHETT